MLLHKLAEDIPEDYAPPQKLIATGGDASLQCVIEARAPEERH
jgi:hypothetical protein